MPTRTDTLPPILVVHFVVLDSLNDEFKLTKNVLRKKKFVCVCFVSDNLINNTGCLNEESKHSTLEVEFVARMLTISLLCDVLSLLF
jgi:hypothetical protein